MKKISLQIFAFFCAAVIAGCTHGKTEPEPVPPTHNYLVQVTEERHVTDDQIIQMIEDEFDNLPEKIKIGGLELNTKDLLRAEIPDVTVAKLLYRTPDHDGKIVNASGVVVYPTGIEEYDHIVSVQHGTCQICDPPSGDFFPVECATVVIGDVVCLADYLGYGATQNDSLYHPYIHHQLTATTCADMFYAAEEYLADKEFRKEIKKTGDDIRLFGYSQGGTATVSTLMEMEKRGLGPRIKDVRAGGGPFNLETFFNKYSESDTTYYSEPAYIIMLARGLFYGDNLLDSIDWHNILAPGMFQSEGTFKEGTPYEKKWKWDDGLSAYDHLADWHIKTMNKKMDTLCGKVMSGIFHPDGFDHVNKTPENHFGGNEDWYTFYSEVVKHSLVNMEAPKTPVKVYHCVVDPKVPRECGLQGAEWLHTTVRDLNSTNHRNGAVHFMLEYANDHDVGPFYGFISWKDLEQFVD